MPATLIREFAARDADRLAAVLAGMRDLPDQLAERRRTMFRDAALRRQVPELHAGRDDYRRLYDGYIESAERSRDLAEAAGSPLAAEFARVADEVRKQRDELFDRWQTLDDLYRIIVDALAIPPDRWPALAAGFRPPDWWYDEAEDPFAAP
jgi:hypothetical protein